MTILRRLLCWFNPWSPIVLPAVASPNACIGMDVDVLLVADRTEHTGRIVEVSSLLGSDHYPTIELDDGRRIGGLECWWTKREKETE
jgi:hypothetical protein